MLLQPLPIELFTTQDTPSAAPQGVEGAPGEPGPGTQQTPPSGPSFLMPLLLVAAIFWFVMIGPERKQRKKRQAMIDALQKGDRVVTNSGIFASVVQVQDDVAVLQVADGVRMRFSKAAIQSVIEDRPEDAPAEAKK